MAPTPEGPGAPEGDDKLELPRLGGLLRRRKKGAQPDPADPEPGTDAVAEPDADEVEETQPVRVVDEDGEVGVVADEDDTLATDHGPDLVAPATAYTEGEPVADQTPARRWRPTRSSMPSLPTVGLPLLEDRFAVPLTGLVVGLIGFLLIYLVQSGCGAVRGAASCGGAGLPLLVVIVVLMVFAGSVLLRAWYVDESLTTSFLAVVLVAVVVMVVLLPVIDRWFMVIVMPVLSAAGFWVSWWVTSRFDAPEREAQRERENAR